MGGRFKKDQLIIYLIIAAIYLIHWVYNDLESNPGNFGVSLVNNVWQIIFVVGINSLYFEYLLPFVTSGKINRTIAVPLSIILQLVVMVFGLFAWRSLGAFLHLYNSLRNFSNANEALSAAARFTPGAFLVFSVFKLFFDYTHLKFERQQVLTEKKQAELLFLKSQINPHFLFNTLNNIYSLAQYQPKLVSESVLRLSKLLRYILYETGNKFITIDKEVKILTDYIDLEKLRYNEGVAINFNYEIEDYSEAIPPLLLIPLVENAFKHGISQIRGKREVKVSCVLHSQQLNFVVENSSFLALGGHEIKEGIGLSNLRRRLQLLYKDFELLTEQKETVFTAKLIINLKSHA